MFYYLWQYLHQEYSWLNLFRYITFRSFLAFVFSFIIVIVFQPVFITYLRKIGLRGQPIRDDGPESHVIKSGTPTMGGLVVIAAVLISSLFFANFSSLYVWIALLVMFGHAALGFVDDWQKVRHQNSKGISAKAKIFSQLLIVVIASVTLVAAGFSTDLTFPFFKNLALPLGVFFILFAALVVVGSANAVNLTDGLDGLAIGPVITVSVTFSVLAYLTGNINLAEYLHINYVSGSGELCIVLASVVAAGLGFLWYNTFPAQVFMGDIGSLSLGGLLGIVAVIVKQEFLLAIAGGIFVLEALSVIIQRYYYKATKKRVFKMAPVHHHFELLGWAEPKIIVRFWIISIILALFTLATLKLR